MLQMSCTATPKPLTSAQVWGCLQGVCCDGLPLRKLLRRACLSMFSTQMLPCLQEFEDGASPSAADRPLPPALLKPQTTGFEEYDPAAFGQDVPLGSSYQPQPAAAEAVPARTADGDGDPTVEQQRRALEQYQKLAIERKQV